jgi:hypothetical protein
VSTAAKDARTRPLPHDLGFSVTVLFTVPKTAFEETLSVQRTVRHPSLDRDGTETLGYIVAISLTLKRNIAQDLSQPVGR